MKKFLLLALSLIIATSVCFTVTVSAAEDAAYTGTAEAEDINAFENLFLLICENADKLFATLAFASSLIVVFAYKRGLIPLINKGLSAIRKSTDNFEIKAQDAMLKTEKSVEFLTDRFVSYENTVDSVSSALADISERLDALSESSDEKQLMKTVMLSQIDMLYEIFMQSGLPQYSKDALGEKMSKMKKTLGVGEENERA